MESLLAKARPLFDNQVVQAPLEPPPIPADPTERLIFNLSPGGKIHRCRTDLDDPRNALHPRHWRTYCAWPFARDNTLFRITTLRQEMQEVFPQKESKLFCQLYLVCFVRIIRLFFGELILITQSR